MITLIRTRLRDHQPVELDSEHAGRHRAAVLVPVIRGDVIRLLLTERDGSLETHGGEVAFPGGVEDDTDGSIEMTALRETHEEVGIEADQVEIVGELRPFISKHGLLVTPVVGVIDSDIVYRPNPDEIASIFEVPIDFFHSTEPTRVDEFARYGETHRVPSYDFKGYEIWGLTAMIIGEFLNVTS